MCNPSHNAGCVSMRNGEESAYDWYFKNSEYLSDPNYRRDPVYQGKTYDQLQADKKEFEAAFAEELASKKGFVDPDESRERFYDYLKRHVHFDFEEDLELISDELEPDAQLFMSLEQEKSNREAQKKFLDASKVNITEKEAHFYPCFTGSPSQINTQFCNKARAFKKESKKKELESQSSKIADEIEALTQQLEHFLQFSESKEKLVETEEVGNPGYEVLAAAAIDAANVDTKQNQNTRDYLGETQFDEQIVVG